MQFKAIGFKNLIKLSNNVKLIRNISANGSAQSKQYPGEVTIVEVGPRDGLQNEKVTKNILS